MNKSEKATNDVTNVKQIIDQIISYLDEDDARYTRLADECVELYIQANNLTFQLLIYVHNNHLIFRVPNYIRNVELRKMEILSFIMKMMNEILDIRFEISPDGQNLSASCQHILEDGQITKKQFDMAMMVTIHLVDDTYPQFMQLVYSQDDPELEMEEIEEDPLIEEFEDDSEEFEISVPTEAEGHKIN